MKVLILEGGFNEEHEISLSTSKEVKKSLSKLDIEHHSIIVSQKNFEKKIKQYSSDFVVFNALHGTFGEDGQIQKILNKFSFKYTHSDFLASNIGFNKDLTIKKIKDTSILFPEYDVINNKDINEKKLFNYFSSIGPFVIKPLSSGSSFGVKIFKNKKNIEIYIK